jgi:hypothetical protein
VQPYAHRLWHEGHQHLRSHLSRGTYFAMGRPPSGLRGIVVSAAGPNISWRLGVNGLCAARRKTGLVENGATPFFLLPGAKKAARHNDGQINGLC